MCARLRDKDVARKRDVCKTKKFKVSTVCSITVKGTTHKMNDVTTIRRKEMFSLMMMLFRNIYL